jgi:glycosyltransferase involved in cell wall biosynthesis
MIAIACLPLATLWLSPQGPGAFVKDGENGLLIPINDTEALIDAMRRMIANPQLRQQCVEGGTNSFNKLYTKEVFIRDSLAFYEKVKTYADKKLGAWK